MFLRVVKLFHEIFKERFLGPGMENLNALFIEQGKPQSERLIKIRLPHPGHGSADLRTARFPFGQIPSFFLPPPFSIWDRLALLGMGPAASPAGAAAAAGGIAKILHSFPGLVTFFNTFVLSFSGNPDAGRNFFRLKIKALITDKDERE